MSPRILTFFIVLSLVLVLAFQNCIPLGQSKEHSSGSGGGNGDSYGGITLYNNKPGFQCTSPSGQVIKGIAQELFLQNDGPAILKNPCDGTERRLNAEEYGILGPDRLFAQVNEDLFERYEGIRPQDPTQLLYAVCYSGVFHSTNHFAQSSPPNQYVSLRTVIRSSANGYSGTATYTQYEANQTTATRTVSFVANNLMLTTSGDVQTYTSDPGSDFIWLQAINPITPPNSSVSQQLSVPNQQIHLVVSDLGRCYF